MIQESIIDPKKQYLNKMLLRHLMKFNHKHDYNFFALYNRQIMVSHGKRVVQYFIAEESPQAEQKMPGELKPGIKKFEKKYL